MAMAMAMEGEEGCQVFAYHSLPPIAAANSDTAAGDAAMAASVSPPASSAPFSWMSLRQRGESSMVYRRVIQGDDGDADAVRPSLPCEEEVEYMSLSSMEGEDGQRHPLHTPASDVAPVRPTFPGAAVPPWSRRAADADKLIRSPLLQLHQEIVDFCDFVSPTNEEQNVRMVAIQRVTHVINSIWPQAEVKIFGSFETGLYLPTSDIDMVILHSSCENVQIGLKALAKALSKSLIGKKLQVIAKARVPIVKFVEKESGISFDISFDLENGPQAAEFIKEAITTFPPLKPLCMVLKIFLQQRELNEVYTGGLGSYMLLVMLLAHLQMHPSRRSYSSSGESSALEHNLGILLVDFFDLYGRALNVKEVGVSCRGGGGFFRKKSRGFVDLRQSYLLSVEDPQTPDNDIGKSSFNAQKVRTAFLTAHRILTTVNSDNMLTEAGLLARIVRLDESLVGRRISLCSLTPVNSSPSTPIGNQQHFSHLPVTEQTESDSPRVLKDENGPQRIAKRKRNQISRMTRSEKIVKHKKHFEKKLHSKNIKKGKGKPFKRSGYKESNQKTDFKGYYKQGREVARKMEIPHPTFPRGNQRWYDDSEPRFQWGWERSGMIARDVNSQRKIVLRADEDMEWQLGSSRRRVITSSVFLRM